MVTIRKWELVQWRGSFKEKVKKPLAEEVLFGNLSKSGGTVKVTVDDNDQLEISTNEETFSEKV